MTIYEEQPLEFYAKETEEERLARGSALCKGLNYLPVKIDSLYRWGRAVEFREGQKDSRQNIAVTQYKANLTWLVYPEVEEGVLNVPWEFAQGMKSAFDLPLIENLYALPMAFMAHWEREHEPLSRRTAMRSIMPFGHLATMYAQAEKAQARLLAVQREGNVTSINFKFGRT